MRIGLENLRSGWKIEKKAHAGHVHEFKWEIPVGQKGSIMRKYFKPNLLAMWAALLLPAFSAQAQGLVGGQWTTITAGTSVPTFNAPSDQGTLTFEVRNVKMRDVTTGTSAALGYYILASKGSAPPGLKGGLPVAGEYNQSGASGYAATLTITSPPAGLYFILVPTACSGCNFVVVSYEVRANYAKR